jgi:phage shock protein C
VNPRRLYRSRTDRKLAGIAAGMADYLDLDPTVVRVLWVVSIFFFGFTIVLYIILAFVIPNEPLPAGSNTWPSWTPPGATGPGTAATGPVATATGPVATAAPAAPAEGAATVEGVATVGPAATDEPSAPVEPDGTEPEAAAR